MYIYQWQSVRGDPEHFDILVISWQFEHFWANNWQGINNSLRTIKLWFNEEEKNSLDFHHIPKLSIGSNGIYSKMNNGTAELMAHLFYDWNWIINSDFNSRLHLSKSTALTFMNSRKVEN